MIREIPRAYRLTAIGAVILVATVTLLLDFQLLFADRPLSSSAIDRVHTFLGTGHCPSRCPSDPFVQPGMLHWSVKGLDNETRWLPFPQHHHPWEDMASAYELPKEDYIPPEAWERSPEMFVAKMEQGQKFDWMKGRTVLFIDDRNNVEQLCDVLKGKKSSWGGHTGGYCYVEDQDILIMNWFLYGMIDSPDGWPYNEAPPKMFEDRIAQVLVPKKAEAGFGDRKPDLVVLSSLFWDTGFFANENKAMNKTRGHAKGLFWSEVAWHRGRVRKLIATVRELYGQNLALMFRTRQLRAITKYDAMLGIFQLDQGCRALAKELDVRLFTWGGKLEGYAEYYDHDMHFALGPNTYLFGDMMFFYLWRAINPGCWGCHQWDD